MRIAMSLVVAALIAGCAGGGGQETTVPEPISGPERIDWVNWCAPDWGIAWYACVELLQRQQAWDDLNRQVTFKGWSQHDGLEVLNAEGTGTEYSAPSGTVVAAKESLSGSRYVDVEYSPTGQPLELSLRHYTTFESIEDESARVGIREGQGYTFVRGVYFARPGLDAALSTTASSEVNPFVEGAAGAMVLAANPYNLGWNYQSFGIWNVAVGSPTNIHALSFGAPSPVAGVPTAGSATFTGVLGGLYISPAGQGSLASASLRVDVDFSARTLGFASTATTLTRDLATSTISGAPDLDLGGTLRYDAGSASFSGTLVNAGGTLSGRSEGRFYGPAAEELGGAFQVHATSGVETFTGAYGAKR